MPTILVICTGNVCRSPLAEAILGQQAGLKGLAVRSAGTAAVSGQSYCESGLDMLEESGVRRGGRGARILTPTLIDEADLVLVAAYEHRGAVALLRPMARRKTFTLKEADLFISMMGSGHPFSGRNEGARLDEQFESIVGEMNNMRGEPRPASRKRPLALFPRQNSGYADELEIADGHWGSGREHRRTLEQIRITSQDVGVGLATLLGRPH